MNPSALAMGGGAHASAHHPELSFEDFTTMSPFLDPASLHLANPYASSLASAAGKR